jgi:hypothetical protein
LGQIGFAKDSQGYPAATATTIGSTKCPLQIDIH